jgi:dynein heavy chain 1
VHWKRFKIPRGTSVAQFISNLVLRLRQLENIGSYDRKKGIWLGGLFQPEAYITATRQTVAHAKGWSLELLKLDLDVEEAEAEEGFVIKGTVCYILPCVSCSYTC